MPAKTDGLLWNSYGMQQSFASGKGTLFKCNTIHQSGTVSTLIHKYESMGQAIDEAIDMSLRLNLEISMFIIGEY